MSGWLPKCDCCGEVIYDDTRYNINGRYYCWDCVQTEFGEINEVDYTHEEGERYDEQFLG